MPTATVAAMIRRKSFRSRRATNSPDAIHMQVTALTTPKCADRCRIGTNSSATSTSVTAASARSQRLCVGLRLTANATGAVRVMSNASPTGLSKRPDTGCRRVGIGKSGTKTWPQATPRFKALVRRKAARTVSLPEKLISRAPPVGQ